MQRQRKLQILSVKNIGVFAVKAIEDPTKFQNRANSLAGDELTFANANAKFNAMYKKDIPRTFGLVGTALKMMVAEMGSRVQMVRRRRIRSGYTGVQIGSFRDAEL